MGMLDRREALKNIIALPGIGGCHQLSDRTRALVLTVKEGSYMEEDITELKSKVTQTLKDAGLEDLPVILFYGLQVHTING